MEYLKRVVGYLVGMKDACIRIGTHEPDFSEIPHIECDWSKSVYGEPLRASPRASERNQDRLASQSASTQLDLQGTSPI